jgi:putative ABC transport system permease protein
MNLVALKMLIGDRLKYVSLVAGLAFASLLIVQQASIFTGFTLRMGAWIRDTAVADLWVMDDQVNFVDDFKPIPDDRLQRVRGIDGIEWAVPMFKRFLPVQLPDGTVIQCRVIGLDDATLVGGPPEMVQGRLQDLRQDRAIFINADQAGTMLAMTRDGGKRPLKVGDRVAINDNEAIVAGTFRSTREFFWDPVIYTTYSRALNWAPPQRKNLNFILAKARRGADVQRIASQIRDTTGLSAYTGPQFDRKSTQDLLGRTGILVNFGITIALGFVIGALIAGQTFYMFVLDNLRYFGALKAMGTSNGSIVRMIFVQTITVGLVGFGVGLGAACLGGIAFRRIDLAFQMPWQIPAASVVAILACCMVAAALSLVRVLRLEPAVVFKG